MLREATKPGVFPLGLSLSFNILILPGSETGVQATAFLNWFNKENNLSNHPLILHAFVATQPLTKSLIERDVGSTASTIPKVPLKFVILRQTF